MDVSQTSLNLLAMNGNNRFEGEVNNTELQLGLNTISILSREIKERPSVHVTGMGVRS